MAKAIGKAEFITDLVGRIRTHETVTRTRYQPLDPDRLNWSPDPGEWSILQCFEHLNETHVYYMERILPVLNPSSSTQATIAAPPTPGEDLWRPSFWAGIYMFFAFNPRFSFPAPAYTRPQSRPSPQVLDVYLRKQQELLQMLEDAESLDLARTRIPIKSGMSFNLGDCLRILVYHDGLHIHQAAGVYARLPAQSAA